jgi:hypothetical protein
MQVYTEWSGKGGWEPDGTAANAPHIAWVNNKPGNSVTWTFALPDGATINNVYAAWGYQGNSGSGHTYTCNEGTPTTFTRSAAASTNNLRLKWTNSGGTIYNADFQRIFAGPVIVAGGDGFKVTFTQVGSGAYPYIDAVVVDYTIPSADPPLLTALSPADDDADMVRNANLVATFNKAVALTGTGTVTIRNKTLNSDQVITLPDAQVTVNALSMTINPSFILNASTDYAVLISNNAVESLNGADFAGIADDTTWNFTTTTDGTAPAITSTNPADGATEVWPYANLVASFSEPVKLSGGGSVTIRDLTLGTDLTINLPNSQVSVSDTQLTINLSGRLATGTDYAVRIGSDAVEDLNGNPFAGIPDDTAWNFTSVVDNTPPEITSTIPADDATGVAPYANLRTTFSEPVQLTGGGSVTIRNVSLGTESTINLPNTQVSVSGAELTIAPNPRLASGTGYAVRISGNAIEDINGNAFAGIADNTMWNFTTAPPPPGGYGVTADHIVSGSVTGTLLAVDVPFNSSTESVPVFGGPDWPENADDGFTAPIAAGDGLRGQDGASSNWEPDGTPLAQAKGYFTFGDGPAPSVTWSFGLPDGAVINAVYATWNTRGADGITYQYTEGAASGSIVRQTGGAAPAADLVLSWTDAASGTHQGNFERIFTGPITVEGGNGFTLWGTDNIGNAAHIDAIVLDVSGKAVITSFEGAGAAGVINQTAKTISLQVPFGTNLATLAPTFTLSSGGCNQTSGAPPSPTFADQNPVAYVVTDTSTDPATVNTYWVTVTLAPETVTLVIDLGTSPAGTTIPGGTFIGSGPLNLPLPALPAGSILQSIAINASLDDTDNQNYASDLSLLLDPTPETPGGDFSVEITNGEASFGGAGTLKLGWPTAADATPPPSVALVDTKTDADWDAAGPIDLGTTGLFLGNAHGTAPAGGTWSGTITLTYEVGSGSSAYATWSGGEPFTGDKNGDGVENGLAFLLGAPDPDADALGLLPKPAKSPTGLVLTFNCLPVAARGGATLIVEHSSDLGDLDPWTATADVVPDVTDAVPDNNVTFVVGAGPAGPPALNSVSATISSAAAAGGKLFGRLRATE